MNQFKSKSGAEVIINEASIEKALALKNAVFKAVAAAGQDIDLSKVRSTQDVDFGKLMGIFMSVESSPAVQSAVFDCLLSCTRNREKITLETFEDAEARRDYYEIVFACAKENLSPFLESLLSLLGGGLGQLIPLSK